MNVKKININQSEPTYDIVPNAYDITYEDTNVGDKLSELDLGSNNLKGISKNIFNKYISGYITGKYISAQGELSTNSNSIVSPLIKVKPNTVYAVSVIGASSTADYNNCFFRFLESDGSTVVPVLDADGNPYTYTATTPSRLVKTDTTVKYIQLCVKFGTNNDIRNNLQIVETDTLPTEYYPYKLYLDYNDLPEQLTDELQSIKDELDTKATYSVELHNLINLANIQPNKRITYNQSKPSNIITNTTEGCVCSAFIPVEAGKTYYLTRGTGVSSDNAVFAFCKANKSTLLTPLDPTTHQALTSKQFTGLSRAFEAPSEAAYALVCFCWSGWDGNTESLYGFQFEEGSVPTPYEPYSERYAIPVEHLPSSFVELPGVIDNVKEGLQEQIDEINTDIYGDKNKLFSYNANVGSTSYIENYFDSTNRIRTYLKIIRDITSSDNFSECLTLLSVYLIDKNNISTSVHSANDDISPLYSHNFHYYGANHGYDFVRRCTVSNHGKTAADIGSIYAKDGINYTIIDIVDNNTLSIIGENELQYPLFKHKTATTGDYTHVSGGTNTNGFSVSAVDNYQQKPIEHLDTTEIFVDGKKITSSGNYYFSDKVIISQNYKLVNFDSAIQVLQNNVGNNTVHPQFAYLNGVEFFAKLNVSYIFTDANHLFIAATLTYLQDGGLYYYGFTQQSPISGNNCKLYIPKTVPYNGSKDWRTNPDYTSQSSQLIITSEYWENQQLPPDRWIENSDSIVFSCGYLYDYGVGGHNRKDYIDEALQLFTTRKIYPRAINGSKLGTTQTKNSSFSVIAYRIYKPVGEFEQSGLRLSNCFELNDKYYLYLDFSAVGTYEINIPQKYIGKTVEVFEKSSNVNLLTPISSNTILVSVETSSPMYGYLVGQIK